MEAATVEKVSKSRFRKKKEMKTQDSYEDNKDKVHKQTIYKVKQKNNDAGLCILTRDIFDHLNYLICR